MRGDLWTVGVNAMPLYRTVEYLEALVLMPPASFAGLPCLILSSAYFVGKRVDMGNIGSKGTPVYFS